jgi:rRNA-processing protein FCF1
VDELLRTRESRLTTVNAAEVVDVVIRRHGGTLDAVLPELEGLARSGTELVDASLDLAVRAGELRGQLFERRSRRLSLADGFALAAAEDGRMVVTTDATLAAAARDAGIEAVELPG